ncbi:helix-turn-helix domain-containing protein [Paenibacillus thermoaerophilus]|uniref:Helix-turn-helix domain-containing protein n=1 Tax=Paenibacillus thermoaerophilus TaxID=1215385 RepID=A0ABW2V2V0_9BACL|nr:AraC family transcriptional regulator [Paenibacillus thermoaerophilus]TMV15993.1 helix-turn-helix domain-containing protein [Paenibacillus thermoaerophilus]
MEHYNEQVLYENPLLSLKVFSSLREKLGDGRWHYHRELEMLAVQAGKMEVFTDDGNAVLQSGDVMLIGANQLHRDISHPGTSVVVLQIELKKFLDMSLIPYLHLFTEAKQPLSRLNYMFLEQPDTRAEVHRAVVGVHREWSRKEDGYEIAIAVLIKQILLTLIRRDDRKLLNASGSADIIRLQPALDYVESHIDGRVQVEDACRTVNLSYYYFVKYFKKVMGLSFSDYVNMKKIKRAERLLLTRDMNVADIGEAIGMPNMAHFYKMFRKYNKCSPNEFRRRMTGR